MGKYRIVDTRFRILKKGKIALACALAIGGLGVGTTAYATDYFTDIAVSLGTVTNTDGIIDMVSQTASNNGSSTASRALTAYDNVVFKPGSWATSTYTSGTYTGEAGGPSSQYTLTSTALSSFPDLTLTFSSGANANNITKANYLVIYSANQSGSASIYGSSGTYPTLATTSSDYTANLVFNGVNTVTGYTNIDAGMITIAGSQVNFAGTVEAGAISIGGSGIYFNSNVDLNTRTMTYTGGYDVVLHAGMNDGNVNFAGNNGTLTLDTGNINGSPLNQNFAIALNAGAIRRIVSQA